LQHLLLVADVDEKELSKLFKKSEWKTSWVMPIFKEKGDVKNCGTCRGVKELEHGMKIVEKECWRGGYDHW